MTNAEKSEESPRPRPETDAPAAAGEVIDTEQNMPGEQGPPPDTSDD